MPKICIVIPCYNESLRLNTSAFTKFLDSHHLEYDLLFVNDGSTDNTIEILSKIISVYPNNCVLHTIKQNGGKAEAVRLGINLAHTKNEYNYIAYFDADLATPLLEIKLLYKIVIDNPEIVMVLCSRIKRLGANIRRKTKRHLLGRIFSTLASTVLKLPVYDTQCGAKLIKAEIIPYIFDKPFVTSWIFDVEILARIRNHYKNDTSSVLFEHPVTEWEDVEGSKLRFRHMIRVPLELIKINQLYNK